MTGILGTESSRHFLEFADEFLKEYFDFYPNAASYMGLHEYDGLLPDLNRSAIDKWLALLDNAQAELDHIDPGDFDRETLFDYNLLRQAVGAEIFRYAELRELTYSPMATLYAT